jgi:light-regulated signal transduction histidine kinase (bacteriophytochrome)
MNEKERELEVKKCIREILSDKDSYDTTLKTSIKFLNKALRADGENLKELCRYIIGNSVFWRGPNHLKIKSKLRKFSFSAAVKNRRAEIESELDGE